MTKQFVNRLEDEATAQLDAIGEYRKYRGNDPDFRQRAKIALGLIGAYVRLRATIANEKSNELIELRLLADTPASRRQLSASSQESEEEAEKVHA